MEKDEIKWNEMGFGFKLNRSLTEWAHRELNDSTPGIHNKYVILDVFEKTENDEVRPHSHILFDTSTQQPVRELHLDSLEGLAVQLDIIKLGNAIK